MTTVVHFCQNYRAGELGFQKRRVPHNIFSCESPLLVDAPADLAQSTYKIKGGEVSSFGSLVCLVLRHIVVTLVTLLRCLRVPEIDIFSARDLWEYISSFSFFLSCHFLLICIFMYCTAMLAETRSEERAGRQAPRIRAVRALHLPQLSAGRL